MLAEVRRWIQLEILSVQLVEEGLAHLCRVCCRLCKLLDRKPGGFERGDRPVKLIGIHEDLLEVIAGMELPKIGFYRCFEVQRFLWRRSPDSVESKHQSFVLGIPPDGNNG